MDLCRSGPGICASIAVSVVRSARGSIIAYKVRLMVCEVSELPDVSASRLECFCDVYVGYLTDIYNKE